MTESKTDPAIDHERRRVLASAVGLASAGAAGYLVGTESAKAATAVGEVGTSSNPYIRAYLDRIVFNERTDDPSSPNDGELWYNSSE